MNIYMILLLSLYLFSILLNEIVQRYVSHQCIFYKYDRRIQKYLKSIYSNLKQALILLAVLIFQQLQRLKQNREEQNTPKTFALLQYELKQLQSMINTQYTCNRCFQKVTQVYYCHQIKDGICYPCSKTKDRCSICNKKSNIPVTSSQRKNSSSFKQSCNICEKSLYSQEQKIVTECKHLICISCLVIKICKVLKNWKNTSKKHQLNPLFRIKCNCLLSQSIKLQNFLNNHCFKCGETLQNDNYQQLLFGLKISWKCKALFSPGDYRNGYIEDDLSYMDIQQLSKAEKYEKPFQSSKQQKYTNNHNQKIDKKNQQRYIESPKQQQIKPIDSSQIDMISCVACDKSLDKYSLFLVDDSFHLCSQCHKKSKSYISPSQKIKQRQFRQGASIEKDMKKLSTSNQPEKRNRIFFQDSRQQMKQNHQKICISCNKQFDSSENSSIKVKSQISDMICRKCHEITHDIIEKKQDRSRNEIKNSPPIKKSRKSMSYSQYLRQISIIQSPQITQVTSQLLLQRKTSQQNKDRRAIYSVVQQFPQFQQLQIDGEQGQTSYCYNCKLFMCKKNLIDCSNLRKRKSMACKMCYLILFSK